MNQQKNFVGMDLGTYKTSIASSTGEREVLRSTVGWPKDLIARSLLQRDVVFGDDIDRHRLALRTVRPLAKGALKYLDAASAGIPAEQIEEHKESVKLLVQHAVSLMKFPEGSIIYGAIGVPSRAAKESKQFILEAGHSAMAAVMVVHEPFAVAYGMNRLTRTMIVDIGAGTTDICPMYGSYTAEEDQLTLPIGGDHIDHMIITRVATDYPGVRMSEHRTRELKEKFGTVRSGEVQATWRVTDDSTVRELDLTAAVVEACRSLVTPIVDGIRQVASRFEIDMQRELLHNIVLAGGGSQLVGLDLAIEAGLQRCGGGRVTKVADAVYAGAAGALKLAMNMPAEQWAKLSSAGAQRAAA
jgi:rod shape-determining protein MreB